MAERNPNRKSNRSFNLDKGGQHSFDLGKGTTRKFELGKDDEPVGKPVSEPSGIVGDNESPGTESSKNNKSIIWIILTVIVAAVIAFFCFRGCKSEKDELQQPTGIEQDTSNTVGTTDVNSDSEESPIEEEADAVGTDDEVAIPEVQNTSDDGLQKSEPDQTPVEPNVPQTSTQNVVSSDIEKEALNVIRGDYGVGQERKDRLGSQYSAIQARVNEMKRQGLF